MFFYLLSKDRDSKLQLASFFSLGNYVYNIQEFSTMYMVLMLNRT